MATKKNEVARKTDTAKATKEEAPIKVAIVPPAEAGLTDQQKAEMAESNSPENVENRNKSYEMPNLVVNQNAPEE